MRVTNSLRQMMQIVSHHSWTRLILVTALVVSGTALANRFTSAGCFVQAAGTSACRYNGVNPCSTMYAVLLMAPATLVSRCTLL